MPRIVFDKVSFSFDDRRPLLRDLEFVLEPGFTGLVGANGCGKSTLLRLIDGALQPDTGQLRCEPRGLTVRTCEQRIDTLPEAARALAQGSEQAALRLRGRLGLVSSELERWPTLSPGERKRWQIAAALFEEPDVLLLDEPTNHLDAAGLAWLDQALQLFHGVGVLVAHDRTLLDCHTHSTLRIQRGVVRAYALPYGRAQQAWQAEEASARELASELCRAERGLERRVHQARAADERRAAHSSTRRRMKGAKDHDAQSINRKSVAEWASKRSHQGISALETRLAQTQARERPVVPRELGRSLQFAWRETKRSHVVTLDQSAISVAGRVLLCNVRVDIERAARVGIRGNNGEGKSTLLSALLGAIRVPRARVLHLPQDIPEAEGARCLAEVRALPAHERGRVFELVSALGAAPEALLASQSPSPGETRKLLLALGLSRELEALFLDEPTNHLDLPSIERLEAALKQYPGTLIVVSHDSEFLARTTERSLIVASGAVSWL